MASTSAASKEQALIFSLRAPTTPLDQKLQLALSALDNFPSSLLSQLIRDWIIDLFLRSRSTPDTLLSPAWWSLLAQVSLDYSSAQTSSPTLPIFVAFVQAYPTIPASSQLLESVLSVWRKLAGGAMRKATVDAALDSYASLLKSSLVVVQRAHDDVQQWEQIGEIWLKVFRAVVDSGKGGKKVRDGLASSSSPNSARKRRKSDFLSRPRSHSTPSPTSPACSLSSLSSLPKVSSVPHSSQQFNSLCSTSTTFVAESLVRLTTLEDNLRQPPRLPWLIRKVLQENFWELYELI